MDDLISRKALLEPLVNWRNANMGTEAMRYLMAEVIETIDSAPAIDAVPVVWCKDCENWDRSWECSSGNHGEHFCPMIVLVTDSDFYCKHGAKMDGDPHDSC